MARPATARPVAAVRRGRHGGHRLRRDAAAKAYVALTLEGKDTLLMAADHARRQELSRRIRDALVHLGLVDSGPTARIANGASASAGDLIVCTKNDHSVQAGEPGRTLANGDLLRVEAVTGRGLIVRRPLDADPGPASGGGRSGTLCTASTEMLSRVMRSPIMWRKAGPCTRGWR